MCKKFRFGRLFRKKSPIEKIIGYKFRDQNLLYQSLTHRSLGGNGKSYERLEFLGDAVLSLLVSDYLLKKYKDKNEGDLTSFRSEIVKGSTLAQVGKRLSLEKYVLADKSVNLNDLATTNRILASLVESIIGAVYLDGGIKAARKLVKRFFADFKELDIKDSSTNYKGRLIEYCQKNNISMPVFRLLKSSGPEHAKTYTVGVFIRGKYYGSGSASKKRTAEQLASQKALQKLTHTSSYSENNK